MTLAHGVGGRSDLPLDVGTAALGAGLAVAVSFLALAVLRPRPWLDPDRVRPLPGPLTSAVRRALGPLRALVLVAALLVVGVALFGPAGTAENVAPWVLHVWVWVGVAFASALLGPVWRAVNPLRTLARLLPAGKHPLPERVGLWPAAAGLAVYLWLELVAPFGADPRVVGGYLLAHAAVQLAFAARYGEEWLARADPFEVVSTLLGTLSPLAVDGGRLVLRHPLAALLTVPPRPGLTAVVVVLLGGTAFDGASRSVWWAALPASPLVGTAGFAAACALVAGLYVVATRRVPVAVPAGGPACGEPDPATRFAPTLVPVVLGYAVAHYFSYLVLEGQTVLVLLGLLPAVDYTVLSPAAVATVQVNAVVLGHVAATAAAHDLALRTAGPDRARAAGLPLAVVMVALTCLAIVLLLSG